TFFLTFYFFIPRQLNLTRKNYSREDFYADMHTYIRFRNPRFTLAELLDKSNAQNPLFQIAANMEALRQDPSGEEVNRKIIHELRLFGTIFRSFLKGQVVDFIKIIRQKQKEEEKALDRQLDDFIAGLREMQAWFRQLVKDLSLVDAQRELKETLTFARGFLSLELQNNLTILLDVYRKRYGKAPKKTSQALIGIVEEQLALRKSHGSNLVRDAEHLNENFTYWEGILKKYFQGVLFLDVRDKDTTGKAQHIFYGIAAGVAMFLSVMLGYWIGLRFSSEQSTSFIIAIVAAYIIKDRTKDIIRAYSTSLIRRFFPDRKFDIEDPLSRKSIGTVRETMHFLAPRDVPAEIQEARRDGHTTRIEEEARPEEIFVYHKTVSLNTRKISRRY
ncbi:MAG: hypothetical protein FWG35_06775, partial [Spirochaetaceae bacterium]|nr:hypothetical protein [Spirochaetaceae bacterium]